MNKKRIILDALNKKRCFYSCTIGEYPFTFYWSDSKFDKLV
ncbi:hypothetical protein BACINT_00202 [Bacteroides intestinalis DSM 17393]|uniref:Uncharacterized protein n=1 Tax=Bacteroides intestinalis DSM 17393 TaxID=471870 RepID=B3C5M0_9BACE|nr:hypothetical protein BACINT_00202 [Bacteroides intestinalis DSM 17393]